MSAPRTVAQAIEDAAQSSNTGFRFVEENNEAEPFFSYGGIERNTARYGAAFQALGLKKGDRVALVLPDNTDFVFAFLGAIRAGVVPVPIYPPTGLGKLTGYLENTMHIVARSGARVLLTSTDIKRILGTVVVNAPDLEQVFDIESFRRMKETFEPVAIDLDDACFLQFTSGSTAKPKGVTLTHRNLAANVRSIMELGLRIREEDNGVSWLPLYHDMGLIGFVIAPLFHTRTITFLPPLLFLKRPVRWLQAITRHRGSISFGPNFAYALCVKRIRDKDMQGLDLSTWRVAGCGAEPIRAENLRAFAEKFREVGFDERAFVACYGMAEATLAISFSRVGEGIQTDRVKSNELFSEGRAVVADDADSAGTSNIVQCGPAFEDHEVAAFAVEDAESTNPLPDREVGELRIKGPSVMVGYYDDPELTEKAFAGDWLRTGDMGYLVDGNVHICGRSKEVIIVNGRNYYPQDLEWEASRVAGVRKGNVVAFGTMKPLMDRERVVVAFETTLPEGPQREELLREVRRVIQQGLSLTVDDVVPLDAGALPKTSSGKLQRAATRDMYEVGALLDRTNARKLDRIGAVKEIAKSQLGYFRHAINTRKRSG